MEKYKGLYEAPAITAVSGVPSAWFTMLINI